MIVLSLFDGIACGMVALKRCGICVDKYFASEIDSSAIKVAIQNHPEIIEIGDVRNVLYKDGILKTDCGEYVVGKIDLMFGGSPCTNFSSIGYANGMISGETEILSLDQYLSLKDSGADFIGESYLFWEYCRLLKEVCPKYFCSKMWLCPKSGQKLLQKRSGSPQLKLIVLLFLHRTALVYIGQIFQMFRFQKKNKLFLRTFLIQTRIQKMFPDVTRFKKHCQDCRKNMDIFRKRLTHIIRQK